MPILVIVESGAKGPKIEKMLGTGYQVRGCYGHMQDIPHNLKWIDQHASTNWDPSKIPYNESPTAKKTISELRKLTKAASKVIIASDMDREGEAIGFHIRDLLKLDKLKKPTERIVFDQITPEAIKEAIAHPTELREPLYRAQQARRVIDIIFGYTVSPLLWHIRPSLSAGRCQSPALRWLYQRQEEFMSLTTIAPKHNIVADLLPRAGGTHTGTVPISPPPDEPLSAKYIPAASVSASSAEVGNGSTTSSTTTAATLNTKHTVLHELERFREWVLAVVVQSKSTQSPPQPLTTSAMQQKCYQRFKWSAKTTNMVAQALYEAGHITYIRTDCKVLSAPFVKQAQEHLLKTFGGAYVASGTSSQKAGRKSKKQALAQEAHEPIRPVHCSKRFLSQSECQSMKISATQAQALYTFVYETTMSSLMTPCVLDKYVLRFRPKVAPVASSQQHLLQKELSYIRFPGFRVWEVKQPFQPQECPYTKGGRFQCTKYVSEIKHPLPIRPYSSGELLKDLEKNGIGRPSTYSSIIERLETRKYIEYRGNEGAVSPWQRALEHHPLSKNTNEEVTIDMRPRSPKWTTKTTATDIVSQLGDRYYVTTIGKEAIHYLLAHEKLRELTDTHFTKSLEKQLDDITTGKATYSAVVRTFYEDLMRSTKGMKRAILSGVDSFRNHPTKRLLEEHEEHYFVAMETSNGQAVALLYKDPKRKKEAVFANIPSTDSVKTVTLRTAKALLHAKKQQTDANGGKDNGTLLGTKHGKTVYAKTGRYGHYLIWSDSNEPELPEQTTTFVNKSVGVDEVTLAQAIEWIDQAKLTLRKVNATYTVKYNPKYDSLYVSKPNAKSKGRPLCAPLPNISRGDWKSINALKVKDCVSVFEEKQSKCTPPKRARASGKTKQTTKRPSKSSTTKTQTRSSSRKTK